jgi:hypothetical protein
MPWRTLLRLGPVNCRYHCHLHVQDNLAAPLLTIAQTMSKEPESRGIEKDWMNNLVGALQTPVGSHSAPNEGASLVPDPTAKTFISDPEPRELPDPFTLSPFARSPRGQASNAYSDVSWSDRNVSRTLGLSGLVAILACMIVLCFFFREQVGQTLITLGQKLSGDSTPVATTAATLPAPAESAPPEVTPAAQPMPATRDPESPKPQSTSADLSSSSTNPAPATQPTRQPQRRADHSPSGDSTFAVTSHYPGSQTDFRLGHQLLVEANTPEAKSKAVQLLWAAVSEGSSDAEIELACLYSRGDGVRKNCQQARILFGAARDLHNPGAGAAASELATNGCR